MWVLGVDAAAVLLGLGALALVARWLYRSGRSLARAAGAAGDPDRDR